MKSAKALLISLLVTAASAAQAVDLEVTHWWTSGGEAAAVKELAKAFNQNTEHNWVDGAIAGAGGTAISVIISRILGGDPMAATQLNHGRQSEELIEAGMMTDLTSIAEKEGWRDLVNPSSLLDSPGPLGRKTCNRYPLLTRLCLLRWKQELVEQGVGHNCLQATKNKLTYQSIVAAQSESSFNVLILQGFRHS